MANPEHLEILMQGVERWNKWRKKHPDLHPNLSAADLLEADLRGALLSGADISGADLSGADLSEVDLAGSSLSEADLSEADLGGARLTATILVKADLSAANLRSADLSKADLAGALLIWTNLRAANLTATNLSRADLRGTYFYQAIAAGTIFGDVDLRAANDLDGIQHHAPSIIGIDTIHRSGGKIPEKFLRGCGVPDEFIAYIGSMVGRPIEFYSCFISYSTKDQEFADRLYADLQNKGVRCWFAPHDIQGGRKIHEQIDEGIRMHDKLLLILSEDSMNSEWVKTEIAKARKRELIEKRKMLFPVSVAPYDPVVKDWECFDADTGKDSAREIREYYIPDFSSWKDHDSYQKAFQRLVGDLKAETKSAAG